MVMAQSAKEYMFETLRELGSWIRGKKTIQERDFNAVVARIQETLLAADVPYTLVDTLITQVKTQGEGKQLLKGTRPAEEIMRILMQELSKLLGPSAQSFDIPMPGTCIMVGLQGSGKTTTLAKLARWIVHHDKKQGKKPRRILCTSLDFQRPAAIDQLEVLAQRIGCDMYRTVAQTPQKAAEEIRSYAHQHQYDLIFCDTAGRLHTDAGLLEELRIVTKILQPQQSLLVLDGMIGQSSLAVAQQFSETLPITGGIITKVDSEAPAGATLAFRSVTQKPLLFLGTGEGLDDLEFCHADRLVRRILGEGDLIGLAERAQERLGTFNQEQAEQKLKRGTFTLEDFAQNIGMLERIGSLGNLIQYLPGMGKLSFSQEHIAQGERDLLIFRSLLNSMTRKERLCPTILTPSRKQRIARGAGRKVEDLNRLLRGFEQMVQYAKLFTMRRLPR